ncbi:MAG: hypothetical protein M5U09_29330 [Gammaproteobacteria bacterium]|nr:hypothetical protein [Gammaproteobacteria bacterium]
MPVANVKSNWVNGHLKFSGSGPHRVQPGIGGNRRRGVQGGGHHCRRAPGNAGCQPIDVQEITEINHDGGYGRYNRAYIGTAAISGDALRAFATVENVAAATVRGAHISLSMGASGTVTGLGVALECTLHIPSTAGQTGSLAALKLAINSDAATSDPAGATNLSYMRFDNQGDATGDDDVDTDAYLFSIFGHAAGSGTLIVASATEANYAYAAKCYIDGIGAVWLMFASASG